MSNWNRTDRESSKPTWLTEDQRRRAIRTVRGWEIPLDGTIAPGTTDSSGNILMYPTELIVCMPYDPSTTGVTNSFYANRSINATGAGATAFADTNAAPFFTSPLTGDSFSVTLGTTAFIRLLAGDPNTTDYSKIVFGSLSAGSQTAGISLVSGNLLTTSLTGATFSLAGSTITGGYGGITFAAAAIKLVTGTANAGSQMTGGSYTATVQVSDGRSLTGSVRIFITVS